MTTRIASFVLAAALLCGSLPAEPPRVEPGPEVASPSATAYDGMPPLFLPDIENNPQPVSRYYGVIQRSRAGNLQYPQIWHLLAYKPQLTEHMERFTAELMYGPGPLHPGLRELIAAYVSGRNHCNFCASVHAGVASEQMGDPDLVRAVLYNLETSPLPEREKALLRFIDKVNYKSSRITAEDMKPLYEVGWNDEAIYQAVTICALFNFYNRWTDAIGVQTVPR